jgi:hypothetical protein
MNKLVFFIVISLWGNTAFPQRVAADVEELKIAFVYNFSKYITWPDTALTTEDFTFCIAGSVSLIDKFNMLADKMTQQKTIRVVPVQTDNTLQDCHVFYVASDYYVNARELLASSDNQPMLTVGDSTGFAAAGGVVELMEVDNKITFRINNAAAAARNLNISSQLLRLAR